MKSGSLDLSRNELSAITASGKLHGSMFSAVVSEVLKELTFEKFLDKIEVVSIGQISGEFSDKSDFITRQLT